MEREATEIVEETEKVVDNGVESHLKAISNAIRIVPHFPKPGIMFNDITTLFLDHEAFRYAIDIFVERYRSMDISAVAGIEARGFIFGSPITLAIGAKFVPLRKPRKRPGEVISETYELEYGNDCLEIHVGAIQQGEKVLVIDDLVATGGTLCAVISLLGIGPAIIGGFSGFYAFMGVAATFTSATLVKKLGILKAGASGLIFQASLLTMAISVLWSGLILQRIPLFIFLSMIVLSKLGHMSYDVIGTQILQIGIPTNKANLIGATEVSMASLAEFMMLGVAIVANDVLHFRFLALLSVCSVAGATFTFCRWLSNPSEKQRKLFSCNLHHDSLKE